MRFLVWDNGHSLVHALKLAEKHKVLYFTPWQTDYPKFIDYCKGMGTGIEKVKYFYNHVDSVDYIVAFDIGAGDMVEFLRSKGYKVFGAGLAETLEFERSRMVKLRNELDHKSQPTWIIKGLDNLRRFLSSTKTKVYIKLDTFRGDLETASARSLADVDVILDNFAYKVGPFKDNYTFIVEKSIDGIVTELGIDGYFNGHDWVKPILYGREFAKLAYIGKWVNELPEPLRGWAEALRPLLASLNCRSAVSVEFIIDTKGHGYLLDMCCRMPYPLSACYGDAVSNFDEIVMRVAEGKPVSANPVSKYVGVLPITSELSADNWIRIDVSNDIKPRVAVRNNSVWYGVKGHTNVANIVAFGDSVESVVNRLKNRAHALSTPHCEVDEQDLDSIVKEIKDMKSIGIDF